MNRTLFRLFCALVMGVVCYYGAMWIATRPPSAQNGQWKRTRPYKAFTIDLTTRLASGGTVRESYAQRSDGSFVRSSYSGDVRASRSIDFSDGTKVVMYDRLGLKSTVRDNRRFINWSQSNEQIANNGCEQPSRKLTFLRNDLVLGRNVKVFDVGEVPPNVPNVKITSWVDPTLDCFTVRHEIQTNDGLSVKEAVLTSVGEPDPKLFFTDNAIEVSPTEALRKGLAALGVGACQQCEVSSARRETYYNNHRP